MDGYYRDFYRNSAAKMTRLVSTCFIAVTYAILASNALADTDGPPLYVAVDGDDHGNCLSQQAPCQTIQYALQRVGKNGQIRIASGSFEMTDPADVIYVLSGSIDVQGSYDAGAGNNAARRTI